jgi:plasmid stabilization system protein ParE
MIYRLVVAPQALEAWKDFIDYLAIDRQSPITAERWLRKSWDALQTLKRFPQRCPRAPESDLYPHPIRMLLVDRCLFLFRIDDTKKTVRVLGFRHASQLPSRLATDKNLSPE